MRDTIQISRDKEKQHIGASIPARTSDDPYFIRWYVCTKEVTVARTTVPSTRKRISGATRSTFKLTSAQRGKYVAVLVTGTSLRTTATTWLSKTTAKVR